MSPAAYTSSTRRGSQQEGTTMNKLRTTASVVALSGAFFGLAACGGTSSSSSSSTTADSGSKSSTSTAASNLVGPGCAAYAKQVPSGAGSVDGMAQAKVATAASNNPLLKTLVAAVSGKLNPKVNLVDALNGGTYTVFAPVDDAFGKLPKATVSALAQPANAKMLSTILTYHVVDGQLSPTQVDGSHKTLQGGKLDVKGSGDNITVNGAHVICGGVKTANATVYLIDSVLDPAKMSHF
jgi:uncharacterized surface protein with fasciclin (FAS1) repeats